MELYQKDGMPLKSTTTKYDETWSNNAHRDIGRVCMGVLALQEK